MNKELFKKTMHGIVILLAILAIVLIAAAVRLEIYVPELINSFLFNRG